MKVNSRSHIQYVCLVYMWIGLCKNGSFVRWPELGTIWLFSVHTMVALCNYYWYHLCLPWILFCILPEQWDLEVNNTLTPTCRRCHNILMSSAIKAVLTQNADWCSYCTEAYNFINFGHAKAVFVYMLLCNDNNIAGMSIQYDLNVEMSS